MKSMKIAFCFSLILALLGGYAIPVRAYYRESFLTLRYFFGLHKLEENPGKLVDASCGLSGGLGTSFKIPDAQQIFLDFELWGVYRAYNKSFISDGSATLGTTGVFVGIRKSSEGILRIYGTAGIGECEHSLSLKETYYGGETTYRYIDRSLGYYLGWGLELNAEGMLFSIDYRYFLIEGDFSKFNIGDIDISSSYFGISFGLCF